MASNAKTNVPKITSINDLKNYSNGNIVELPPFGEGQPFIARIRRPSMLSLAKNGKIPNTLLGSAGKLFIQGGMSVSKTDDIELLGNMYDITKIICEACLVEPSMKDLEEAGIELTDEQIMAIFNYSQVGIQALNSFRKQ